MTNHDQSRGQVEGACCCCSVFLTKAAACGQRCVRSQSSSCARLCLRHWHPLCFKTDYRLSLFYFFFLHRQQKYLHSEPSCNSAGLSTKVQLAACESFHGFCGTSKQQSSGNNPKVMSQRALPGWSVTIPPTMLCGHQSFCFLPNTTGTKHQF